MTCVIGFPLNSRRKILLAAGSLCLDGKRKSTMRKLVPGGARWTVGISGDVSQALACIEHVKRCVPHDVAALEAATSSFVEAHGELEGRLIYARWGELVVIREDGSAKCTAYPAAIGSGDGVALGFLYAHKAPRTIEDARRLCKRALRAVEVLTGEEGPPYVTRVV